MIGEWNVSRGKRRRSKAVLQVQYQQPAVMRGRALVRVGSAPWAGAIAATFPLKK
jgi:hypothetical protein